MTVNEIKSYIEQFSSRELPRLRRLEKYYKGDHDILRGKKDTGKPDARLVNNFCRTITDSTVGYFMGRRIGHHFADDDRAEKLIESINHYNDDHFANTALARDLSVYGRACELIWYDSAHMPRFTPLDVMTVIPVYDGTVENELRAAIRFYSVSGKSDTVIELYESDKISTYIMSAGGELTLTDEHPHCFGMVPVNFYFNNRDAEGDFEQVITLIDAYNLLQSESVNDFELFADSYLAISGMGGTTKEDIERLRRDRVLLLDEGGDAKWLTKSVNDAYVENLKTRIAADIFRFSGTVDMTENATLSRDLSGVAIKWRMLAFDNRVAVTESYFRRGVMRRWELISNLLSALGKGFDWRSLRLTFTRNLPGVIEDAAETALKLNGIVSKRTLLGTLPIVESPEAEMMQIKTEGGNGE